MENKSFLSLGASPGRLLDKTESLEFRSACYLLIATAKAKLGKSVFLVLLHGLLTGSEPGDIVH